MRRPSGLHTGNRSFQRLKVSRVAPPPAASSSQMPAAVAPLSLTLRATRRPSGESETTLPSPGAPRAPSSLPARSYQTSRVSSMPPWRKATVPPAAENA